MKNTILILFFFFQTMLCLAQIEVTQVNFASGAGECDGVIEVLAQGTAGPFYVQVNFGSPMPIPTNTNTLLIEGLCEGENEVIVTNAFECKKNIKIDINSCKSFSITSNPSINQPTSCGATDGRIRFFSGIQISGEDGPHSLEWTDSEGNIIPPHPFYGYSRIENLRASIYTLTVTDANGCTTSTSYDLLSKFEPTAYGETTPSCIGSNTGTISVAASMPDGGPVNFSWDNGEVVNNWFISVIDELADGDHTVTISDPSGTCSIVRTYTVEIRPSEGPLMISGAIALSCSDENDGSIMLSVQGGNPPYNYSWDSELLEQDRGANLPGDKYCVVVTDDCEREVEKCFDLEVELPNISFAGAFACDGDGKISAYTSGGEEPFSFEWSNGATGSSINQLRAGNYCVSVTDVYGCVAEKCIDYQTLGGSIVVDLLQHVSHCNTSEECGEVGCEDDGAISISVNTSFPYTMTWIGPNGFQSDALDIENLEVGEYTVEVSFPDIPPCNFKESFNILVCNREFWDSQNNECENTSDLAGSLVDVSLEDITPVSDLMPCVGALDISISGQSASYLFRWEGPNGFMSESEDIMGLCEGEYCIFVNDGCNEEDYCFDIVNCDKSEIRIDDQVTNTCPNVDFGSVEIFIEGGEEPYDYQWSSGQTTQNLDRLFEGVYTLTVTDRNGCEAVGEFRVTDENNVVPNRPPDECNIYYSCNGMPAYQANVEVASCEYLEEDCRYERCICEDGYELEDRFVGFSRYELLENTCQAIIYCLNEEIYDVVNGDITTREVKMLDTDDVTNETVWYCCSYQDCLINEPDYNLNFNFTISNENNLEFAVIQCEGDDGCSFEAFCGNDPVPFYQYCSIGIGDCIQPKKGDCSDFDLTLFAQSYNEPYVIVNNKKFHKIESPSGEIVWESESHQRKMALLEGISDNIRLEKITPNPFVNEVVLEVFAPEKQRIVYSIFNGAGMKILEDNIMLNSGSNFKTISLSDIEMNGLFFIQAQDENGVIIFRKKIIKHE